MPSSEAAAVIRASLARLYPDQVHARYFDVSIPETRAGHHAVLQELDEQRLSLPAVFIDGRLIYTGTINPLRVVTAVGEELYRRRQMDQPR